MMSDIKRIQPDMFISDKGLVIESDGIWHEDPQWHQFDAKTTDETRDRFLNENNIQVIRFKGMDDESMVPSKKEVKEVIDYVLDNRIMRHIYRKEKDTF